jgi:release factor glutamine methyltransferase
MDPDIDAIAARLRAAGSVFAEDEAAVLVSEADDLEEAVARRVLGEPIEHIVGWAEFHGRRIVVGPGVFVPRHRSEFLVDRALAVLNAGDVVVELCCGAAAFASVLASEGADAWATDIDPVATQFAARNLAPERVLTGDLYSALPAALAGTVDLIVVNAPYVPTAAIATMPSDARDFEPLISLDGGADGLDLHRRIAADAAAWLRPGGRLFIEASERQAPVSAAIFEAAGLPADIAHDEDTDATVIEARRPEAGDR